VATGIPTARNAMRVRLLLAIAATACAANATAANQFAEPWAIVEAGDRSQVREEFPPAITQVDGHSTRNPRRSDPIPPGKHVITIRFETGRVAQAPSEVSREVEIELERCTRYRLVAHRTGGTNWEPKVYSEPIGECNKKFPKAPS
jgi:hypothetical protein